MAKLPDGAKLYFHGPEHAKNTLPKEQCVFLGISRDGVVSLLEKGEQYWGANSIGGSFHWVKVEEGSYNRVSPGLEISYHKDWGFLICYVSLDSDPVFELAVRSDKSAVVPVEMHFQTPHYFPSICFHSLNVAKTIVSDFIESDGQSRSKAVQWVVHGDDIEFFEPDGWRSFLQRL